MMNLQNEAIKKLAKLLQVSPHEVIEMYMTESNKYVEKLKTFQASTLTTANSKMISNTARELRHSAEEVGALSMAYACLSLEAASAEYRIQSIKPLIDKILHAYAKVYSELQALKLDEQALA